MRINGANNNEKFFKGSLEGVRELSKIGLETQFNETLLKTERVVLKQRLDELIKKLDFCANRLSKSFTLKDYKTYKETLQGFLKETLGKAYSLKEERGWNRQRRQVLYQSITRIDDKLEELADVVISEQKDTVALVEKMAEIKGIILDIYY